MKFEKEIVQTPSNIILESLMGAFKYSIWSIDKNYRLTSINETFKEEYRNTFKSDIEIGNSVFKGLPENIVKFWSVFYEKGLKGEKSIVEIPSFDEFLELNINPIYDKEEVVGVLVLSKIITKRKRETDALKISEAKYKNLLETAPEAIVIFDLNAQKFVEVNTNAAMLLKYSRRQFLGKTLFNLSPPLQSNGLSSKEILSAYLKMTVEGKNPIVEWTFLDGENNPISCELRLSLIPSVSQTLIRASILDISKKKDAEERIKQFIESQSELIQKIKIKEDSLSSLINSSKDNIFSVDLNMDIVEFNESFYHFMKDRGVKISKGLRLDTTVLNESTGLVDRNFLRALEGETVSFEFKTFDMKGGDHHRSVTYSPIFSESKIIGIACISRDITESKKAEATLLELTTQMAEYKLMALRSLMNPHFLFNCLNSIQYFIGKNEKKLAMDYLSSFSVLIRKILQSSVKHVISVYECFEIIKLYVDLELLRFENKFDYVINVEPNLDMKNIFIPSLLIQPYVENAILHGLSNKEDGPGHLIINLSSENDFLICTISDNGIGRKRSALIKQKNNIKEKESYNMPLTNQRLAILNRTSDVSVHYTDLLDRDGIGNGTLVKLKMKYTTSSSTPQ